VLDLGDGEARFLEGVERRAVAVTADDEPVEPGVVQLQVCWEPGRVVAWAAGPGTPTADADEVAEMLAAAGAPASGWVRHGGVPLPGGLSADASSIPIGEVLGWLVAAGADQAGDAIGPSVRWLGRVAIWAVELTARGSMVPLLRQRKRGGGGARDVNGSYSVRWTPALIDPARLAEVAKQVPGSVLALEPSVDARALTRSALTGMVDAICRDSARRIEVPAPPPRVRTVADATEAFLSRLDGSAFDAPLRVGGEIASRGERSRSVRPAVLVRKRHAVDLGREGPETRLVRMGLRGQREREERPPVEAALERDHGRPLRVRAGDPDRVHRRLGAGVRVAPLRQVPAPGELEKSAVPLKDWRLHFDVRDEWRQMFRESWRLQRDQFWSPDVAQVDWTVQIPLGRLGSVDDVAAAACYLASDEASYITGHVLAVNGGMYM
jgi:hypothetical protein